MTTGSFNPYRQWLGIEIGDEKPNHYQLLKLASFESRKELILEAADRQEAMLKGIVGPQIDLARRIQDEIAAARRCLLSSSEKEEYDRQISTGILPWQVPPEVHNKESRNLPESGEVLPPEIPKTKSRFKVDDSIPGFAEEQVNPTAQVQTAIPDFSANNQHERIESQREKEHQDIKLKQLFDKLLWVSCGICLVAIVGVLISRGSGCNRQPLNVAQKLESKEDPVRVNSQKLKPEKKLQRLEVLSDPSPTPKKTESFGGKLGKFAGGGGATSSLGETIGFYDFNERTRDNDLVDALAPLQITGAKWISTQTGGCLELREKSRLVIDRKKTFDHLKSITIVGRFKTSQKNRVSDLVVLKKELMIRLDRGGIKVLIGGQQVGKQAGMNLDDNQWHRFALALGDGKLRFDLDDEIVLSNPMDFPDLKLIEETPTSVGYNFSENTNHFIGQIDDIGFFWRILSKDEIASILN